MFLLDSDQLKSLSLAGQPAEEKNTTKADHSTPEKKNTFPNIGLCEKGIFIF